MDTKIKILILSLFTAFNIYAQTPNINFAAKFNITSATGGDPYNITGIVLDDLSRFTGSDVQVNDSIYVIDGDQLYVLAVTSITSVVGPTVTLVANDPNNAGVSIPTGQAAICRPTDNYKLPIYISGLRDDLRSMVMNRQAQLIDDINGSAVSAITDFTSAGVNVPPSPAASLNGGETWRNMTTGELWGSDGNVWYPYTRGPKECLDTVLVSAVTIQSGGSLTTGSPLIKNASGVWQHMYNHPSGTNLIPDGVVTDIIVGGKAIIQYCGVRKGSGATPNTSYYVDQTVSTGFTTTKPSTNIRPLGKVASNGDFIINAGLLFSRDNFLNARDSTFAKINGSYSNKRITDNVYKNGTLGLRTTDTTAVLNISVPSEASDKIRLNFIGNAPYLTKTNKDTRATTPVIQDFYTGRSFFAASSPAGDNQVFNGGINYSPGGGHVNRYQNALGWAFETNFKNSSGEPGNPGFGFWETQWPEYVYSDTVLGSDGIFRATGVANNTKRRMFSGYASNEKPSNGGYYSSTTDQVVYYDFKTGQPKTILTFAANMANNKGILFRDTASILFQKNNVGGLYYGNAAGSAILGCFKVDNLNQMVLGFSGINTLYTEASVFKSQFGLTFQTAFDQNVIARCNTFQINSFNTAELMKWDINGTNKATHRMDGNEWATVGSTGNYVLRYFLTAPENSICLSSAGDVSLGDRGHNVSRLDIVTTLGATKKMQMWKNSTGQNVLYRSDATPEGAISGSPGDLCMASVSSVGKLYLKATGTGNTGWEQTVTTSGTSTSISTMMREESFTATASQTAFTIAYSAPAVSGTSVPIRVYRNGVRLFYVASGPTITQFTYSGTTVTTLANTVGDIITIEYLN